MYCMATNEVPEDAEEETEEEEQESTILDDAEELERLYHDEGLSQAEIGQLVGGEDDEDASVTASTVSYRMKQYGIDTRGGHSFDEKLDDPEWLEEQYVDEDRTMQDIGDEVGCSDSTVMYRLRKYDIIEAPSNDDEDDESSEEDEESEDGDE